LLAEKVDSPVMIRMRARVSNPVDKHWRFGDRGHYVIDTGEGNIFNEKIRKERVVSIPTSCFMGNKETVPEGSLFRITSFVNID
jgi:hypothetical protein